MRSNLLPPTELTLTCIMKRLDWYNGTASGKRELNQIIHLVRLTLRPKIDEFGGSTGPKVGITSIKAGDGVTSSTDYYCNH